MNDKPVAAGKSSIDLIDVDKAFEIFDIQSNSTFLDLACGIGRYSLEVAERYGDDVKVISVDLWREGIAQLKQDIASRKITSISPLLSDIRERIDLNDCSVDSCLLATIIHDLQPDEQKTLIQEASRLLKPGGMLNIIEFKKMDGRPGPPITIRLDENDIEQLVTPYGFNKVAGIESGEFTYLLKYRLND
jgi:ubiquinone/menaquinone biosynthesis C-methylase UbiE